MDLKTIYETNFTIFIGIFVTLAVMGTTTLYDKYKSKGGVPVDLKEFKSFSDLNQKITTFSSESLKHFSEYSKKLRGSIQNSSDSSRKSSISVQRNPSKNNPEKVEPIFLKAKDSIQKLVGNLRNKISSISSTLPRRNKNEDEKFVSLSDKKEQNKKEPYSKFSVTDNVNNLEKIVESKKDELDFDDDLLTQMSTSGTLKSNSSEANITEPFFGEMSSEFDESLENDLMFDENEI